MTVNPSPQHSLRALPAVDRLIAMPQAERLIAEYGREAALDAMRVSLDQARTILLSGKHAEIDPTALLNDAAVYLALLFRPTLRPVINATGVIIHTNLGRAPLSDAAIAALQAVASGYSTLEYDLDSGERGSRLLHPEKALLDAVHADSTEYGALVVNNNAAATVLLLAALAVGREVIVSRGQLVEIGGGFRVPDIMIQSGATLVEVGTTNRTRGDDYEQAITPETALLLRVHASNFKQIGFVENVGIAALAEIAHRHKLYAVDDLGSGALIDTSAFGLDHEPTPQESLAAGADVICFSGDKLLGGPQAGILIGRRALIDRLKKHPLARAVRADKLCIAALVATLDHYRKGEHLQQIPVLRMIARPLQDIRATAEQWAAAVGGVVIAGESTVGGGSLPGATLPTALLALDVPHPNEFAAALRRADPPIIARIAGGRVLFDPRTVLEGQESVLLATLARCLKIQS